MTLNVNGYNSTFQKIADVAQQTMENGNNKAIANAGIENTQGGIYK